MKHALIHRSILAALALLLTAGAAQALPYTAPTRADYTTGTTPTDAASADVNNDGMPDLITSNYNDGTVSVFLNGGGGIFLAKVDYPVEAGVSSVVASYVNGDGFLDLIVACRGTNNIAVMLGNGTGAFNSKVDYLSGTEPVRAMLGDVNGDGINDLLSLNRASSNVSVRLGTGGGVFGSRADFATGLTPLSFDVHDVNGDNCDDVVTANYNNSSVSVLLANGTGGYLPKTDISLTTQVLGVTFGYFNADNFLDIAIANFSANRVNVLFGDGAGGFGSRINLICGTQPYSVHASDINLDGNNDIVCANYGSATMSVFYGSGTGTFSLKTDFAVGVSPGTSLAMDVSGDGEPDLLSVNQGSNTFSLRKGNVPGGFSVGDTLVDLAATDEAGNPRALSAGNGKWRTIELCAVWCPTCNQMGDEARQVCDTWTNVHPLPFEYVTVLAEGPDGGSVSTVTDAVNWRTKYQQNSPVLHTNNKRQSTLHSWALGVHAFAYPVVLIVDPAGIIKGRYLGRVPGQDMVDLIAGFAGVAPAPALAPPLPPLPPPPPTTPTLPWYALASASLTMSYGNTTWSSPLGAPIYDTLNERAFHLDLPNLPGIPSSAFVELQARTDSTTGLESYVLFVAATDPNQMIATAQPWHVSVSNMTWDDGQLRVLSSDDHQANVYTLALSPQNVNQQQFTQAPIFPITSYTGTTLNFEPFVLSGLPPNMPAGMFGFAVTDAYTEAQVPDRRRLATLRLAPPIPNPARNGSSLRWTLARAGEARVRVIDLGGRLVRTLHDGAATAGDHVSAWDLSDSRGAHVAPGLYFIALEADGQPTRTTRLVVVR